MGEFGEVIKEGIRESVDEMKEDIETNIEAGVEDYVTQLVEKRLTSIASRLEDVESRLTKIENNVASQKELSNLREEIVEAIFEEQDDELDNLEKRLG